MINLDDSQLERLLRVFPNAPIKTYKIIISHDHITLKISHFINESESAWGVSWLFFDTPEEAEEAVLFAKLSC